MTLRKEKLDLINNSTVAIGMLEKDSDESMPLIFNKRALIAGTGFFIGPNGYIMTVAHVLNSCFEVSRKLKRDYDIETKIAAFRVSVNNCSEVRFDCFKVLKAIEIGPWLDMDHYAGPTNLDLLICKCESKSQYFLEIKSPYRFALSDEVIMCGQRDTGNMPVCVASIQPQIIDK